MSEWATEPERIGEVRVGSRGQEIVSVASEVSASSVSVKEVASGIINARNNELQVCVL